MREADHQISPVGDKEKRTQDTTSVAPMSPNNSLAAPTPNIQQLKIDATDRRQIEAQNEGKSHTTKEVLDDIKQIHDKEMEKKEQDSMEQFQSGINTQGLVKINFVIQAPLVNQLFFNID